MDTVTRIKTPILDGGVSSQNNPLILPNQVLSAVNINCVAGIGAMKRPGTKFMANVLGLDADDDYRLHGIVRDETEKYVVILNGETLKVYNALSGVQAVVTVSATAATYLASGSPTASDIGGLTAGDTTILWNREVVPLTFDNAENYTVTATYQSYDELDSVIGALSGYYRTSQDITGFPAGHYQYQITTAADNGWASWLGPAASSSGYRQPYGKYDEYATVGFRIRFQKQTLANSASVSFDGTNLLTFSGAHGFTYTAGLHVYVSVGDATNLPAGYYPVTAVGAADTLTITPGSGVHPTTGAALSFTPGADTGLTCPSIHTGLGDVAADCQPALTDMYAVAQAIETQMQALGGEFANALVNWQPTSSTSTGGKFQVVAPYRGTGTAVTQIIGGGTAAHDLSASGRPFQFASGTATAGTGSPSAVTATPDSRWSLVAAPGQQGAEIDASTMPMQLRRTAVQAQQQALAATGVAYTHGTLNLNITGHGITTFSGYYIYLSTGAGNIPAGYYPITAIAGVDDITISASGFNTLGNPITATGSATGLATTGVWSLLAFNCDVIAWKPRTTGDSNSNPSPRFFEKAFPIQDLALYRNRMWYLAGDTVFGSVDGDFFNLWIEDTSALVDSDPVEETFGENEVSIGRFLSTWRNKLVADTRSGRQFESNDPDSVRQGSFRMIASTRLRTVGSRPVALDNALYFASVGQDTPDGNTHIRVNELLYDDSQISTVAHDITSHAFDYLPGTCRSIVVAPFAGAVLLAPEATRILYVYRAAWDESQNKRRSAWTSWTFDDGYEIVDVVGIDTDVFMLVNCLDYTDQFVLERFTLARGEAGFVNVPNSDADDNGGTDGGGGGGGGEGEEPDEPKGGEDFTGDNDPGDADDHFDPNDIDGNQPLVPLPDPELG